MILDWGAIKDVVMAAVYERIEDLVCFLIILAIVFFMVWNVADVIGSQERMYRGLTDHCRQVRLAAEVSQ